MFERDTYMPLVLFLNQYIRYIDDCKSLLDLDILRDINALSIHNIRLARERQEYQFLTYHVHGFHA